MSKLKAIVIGAGIHGLTSAIELAKKGIQVTIIEKNPDILMGTSGATHNRAHLGFHYPRSITTAIECLEGLNYFRKYYNNALITPESYYLIEETSKTSFEDYIRFCNKLNFDYKIELPSKNYLNHDKIINGVKVNEPIFWLDKLAAELRYNLNYYNIKIVYCSELIGFNKVQNNYELTCKDYDKIIKYNADLIINATYASSNNTLKILDLEEDMTKYYLQHTEVIVVKSKNELPSMTIMDGKYFSIMKYASDGPNLYLLYDVLNSVVEQYKGYFIEPKKSESNLTKIIEHGSEYFPFMKDLTYITSWFGTRPIPVNSIEDSRSTKIKSHNKYTGIYSILEGKFISAPLFANKLVNLIKEEGVIK